MSDHYIYIKNQSTFLDDNYLDDCNLNIMPEHKSLLLTIGTIITIISIPIVIWKIISC